MLRQIFMRFLAVGRLETVRLLCQCIESALERVIPEAQDHLEECLRVLHRVADGEVIHPERLECDTVVAAQFITMACGGHAGTQAVCAIVEGAGYAALSPNDAGAAHAALAGLVNAVQRDGSLRHLIAELATGKVEGGRSRVHSQTA